MFPGAFERVCITEALVSINDGVDLTQCILALVPQVRPHYVGVRTDSDRLRVEWSMQRRGTWQRPFFDASVRAWNG